MAPPRKFDREAAAALIEGTELSLQEVADMLQCPRSALAVWYAGAYDAQYRSIRKRPAYSRSKLGEKNPMTGKTGAAHPGFIGRAADHKGYYTVLRPSWWTGEGKGKRVFEHHAVYAAHHVLTEIPVGMEIHHIDHDPGNNAPENLELLTPLEHRQRHKQNVSKEGEG